MEEIIFTFDSVTYANKAKRILKAASITTKLVKINSIKGSEGCLHGISVDWEDYYGAVKTLRESGISYGVRRIK